MKKNLLLASIVIGLTVATAHAQPRPQPGPAIDGAIAKLFGDNKAFSATMETHMSQSGGKDMTMRGKMAFSDGNSRFEMDMSDMQGSHMPPTAMARMKQMGMDKMVTVSRKDKSTSYILYPGMKAYVENPTQKATPAASPSDYKVEATKIGEENVDGHDCIKNKVVVTGPDGTTQESTVWNATDLKQFPVKIQSTSENGGTMVMYFKDIKLEKPDASQFDLPADYTKYDSMMSLMMSRARAGGPPQ
jgi:hypothetical protein